jgi:hypothetical protein
MKKNIVYLAIAAMFFMSFVACSTDDGDVEKTDYPVNLNPPAAAASAFYCELPVTMAPTTVSSLRLKSFEITESSKIVVELRDGVTNKPTYVMGDVTQSGNTYRVSGDKVNGTISLESDSKGARVTRASVTWFAIDLTVMIGEVVRYMTENGNPVEGAVTNTSDIEDEVMTRLARTWSILSAIVDLKGNDIKAYEEFDSRGGIFYLSDVLNEAVQQGVNISEKDKAALNKQIRSVTMTKTQKLYLTYVDGKEDVAAWSWANADKTSIKIDLLDQDMGNIFLNDDTRLYISFRDNRCNLRLETTITDDSGKRWEGSLTFKLKSAE